MASEILVFIIFSVVMVGLIMCYAVSPQDHRRVNPYERRHKNKK